MGRRGAMAHILVVEDDEAISDLITMNLNLVGHSFKKAFDGGTAAKLLDTEAFDLVLLDLMLPGKSGFEVIDGRKNPQPPFIIITAKGALAERIKGFEHGCDDYVIKPFDMLELLARINVVLRRGAVAEVFTLDSAEVRLAEKQVFRNGEALDLTAQEFELLEVLIRNRNIALSRETLLEKAWGYDFMGDTRTVDVHVLKLRKKLGWEERIKTVYKTGYRLEAKT
jgi:DNA-binding response OmpR family regulator